MTDEQLFALEAAARAATPDIKSWVHNYRIYDLPPQDDKYLDAVDPAAVLALIDEVRRLRVAVARAICRVRHPHISEEAMSGRALRWIDGRLAEVDSAVWQDYLPEADAALSALAEPTEAMLDAAVVPFFCDEGASSIFRAMISAAGEG